ncbi:MAG TPA: hypothetical protein VIH72_16265 [Candidatus Acidoferrales bacterium]|jgi:hypothetical protein
MKHTLAIILGFFQLICSCLIILLTILIPFLFVIGMYLAILLGLVRVTLMIGDIASSLLRTVAGCGELMLGIVLLLGGTWITTRMAVWIFPPAKRIERAEIPS